MFTETAGGAAADRPILEQVLDQLRPGDSLVVWELDRLGRSLRHRVDIVTGLADRDVGSVACRRQSTHKVRVAQKMYRSGEYTVAAIATTLGVSRASIYRHLDATG